MSDIPIKNLWFLLLYANELHTKKILTAYNSEKSPKDIADLVAELLTKVTSERLQRSLSFHYQIKNEVRNRVRGRIDLFYTERHQLLQQAKVACRFEVMNTNVPRYRYVRKVLEKLALLVEKPELKKQCNTLAKRLKQLGVDTSAPTDAEILRIRYNHNDKEDQYMVHIAYIASQLALINEEAGKKGLFQPDREEHWLRKLFEKAIRNFYKYHLREEGWNVSDQWYKWQIENETEGIESILPQMHTDMVLQKKETRIVIDTKFTSILKKGHHRERTLKSGYLYQIYAYLRSQEEPKNKEFYGLLLHPSVDGDVDEKAKIQGHIIRFATVDLDQDVTAIRERLLKFAEIEQWEKFP